MARIWIVNVAGHDFSDARRFADELIPLTEGRVNIFNVKALVDEFKTKMESYEKEDWLLLSGSSVINIVASQIVMEKHGELKLLIYDAANRSYIPRDINMKQISSPGGIIT